ncbi:hypothetical protein GCM10011507_06130 [Edaphobacter acidisoli]|uniref:Uncharacterized protein n=1 Tax=Edaphobacter acidisoli TaxID=2040573 RepID=A0A916W0Y4_9BACT|nr:hypothetical protein GCM10011507_06130 [Edaphobacter acidisoli]
MSQGLKPLVFMAGVARTEVRAYLRGNDKGRCNGKTQEATAPASEVF